MMKQETGNWKMENSGCKLEHLVKVLSVGIFGRGPIGASFSQLSPTFLRFRLSAFGFPFSIFQFRVSIFQFPFSSFQFLVSSPQ